MLCVISEAKNLAPGQEGDWEYANFYIYDEYTLQSIYPTHASLACL